MEISKLYSEVRRQARNIPEPTMHDAILRAARTFCRDTCLLRRTFQFTTVAGQQQYPIVVPENEEAFGFRHACIAYTTQPTNTWPLRPMYPTTFNPNIGEGCPVGICMVPYSLMALDRQPDQAYLVTVETWTQPVAEGYSVPDEIGVRYDQALGYGALEWLLMQRGNPWFDQQGSVYYRQLFNQEIVKGRAEAAFDFTPGSHEWMNPGFAQTGYGRVW